ncbi:hypothetical protein FD754_008702, partial [Muntiacus muntjak]
HKGLNVAQGKNGKCCFMDHTFSECVCIENYIVENMKSEMAQIQQNAVQNHTATMLEIGTSLLSQTAEQTRKLTDVETQVLNQTSRLEIQLLENSLSTYKLEKQLLQQTNEILKIHEKNSFHPNAKECSTYCKIALISHDSKVMLKILQPRLQQYMNRELPGIQAGFRKGRATRDQIANICWIIEKAREF